MQDQGSIYQRTMRDTAHFVGTTLDTQRKAAVAINPADCDKGLYFVRTDINPAMNTIPARWYNIFQSGPATTLTNQYGVTVSHVELILAALRGCGIDNARIEVDGPEMPVMDGSAKPFIDVIQQIGSVAQTEAKKVYWVHTAVDYRYQHQYAVLSPDKDTRFTIHLSDYDSFGATQVFSFRPSAEFRQQIAPARQFAARHEPDEFISVSSIHDAQLSEILLIPADEQKRKRPLRFEDEYLRHVALESFGFMSLMSHEFVGHLYLKNPTIDFLQKFLRQFFNLRSQWTYLNFDAYRQIVQSEQNYLKSKQRFRHGDTI